MKRNRHLNSLSRVTAIAIIRIHRQPPVISVPHRMPFRRSRLLLTLLCAGLRTVTADEVTPALPGLKLPKPVDENQRPAGNVAATTEALAAADHLLAQLSSDEDEHWKAQQRLCLTLIRLGRHADAEARVRTFGPSYQALHAATLAREWQRRGCAAESSRAAALAEQSLSLSDTWKTMRTCAILAELHLLRRDEARARDWFRRVQDPKDRRSYEAAWLLSHPEPEQIDAFLQRPATENFAFQTELLRGLAEADERAGRHDEAAKRLRLAAARCHEARHPSAAQSLPPLIEAMHHAGMAEEASRTLDDHVAACRRYPDDGEWKSPSLAEAGRLALLLGRRDMVTTLLPEAERSARATFFLHAPVCWMACARLARLAGDARAADGYVREAVKNGAAYPHPRGRAMGLFEVALHHVEEQRAVPGELASELMK